MVDSCEFPVEPHVQVDDRNALQLVALSEVGNSGPPRRHHTFENIDRDGGYVLVSDDLLTGAEEEVIYGSVFMVGDDLFDG